VFLKNLQASTTTLLILITLTSFAAKIAFAAKEDSSVGLTNFAFSSYLGTGFYTSSGQDVFVLQLPFEHTIKEKTNTEPGWVLKLPLTVGFIDYENIDVENLPDLESVATLTFLPGLEYQYPVTQNWTISPFADYGFARDFNYTDNVLITGIGIKSYYNIPFFDALVSLGNRFLYAREKSKSSDNDSDYSLIETGLNYRITSEILHDGGAIFSNLYYINFYYPNNLVFLERTPNPVRVGVEHEVGITFSNIPDFLWFEKSQFGIGVRTGGGVNVYRIVFGAPF